MTPGFWQGRKVLVTGHTGFKGSWLSLWLHQLGAEVVGFSLPPASTPSLFVDANIDRMICSLQGDIRDLDTLAKILREQQPEVVFHLAAQSLVRYSYTHPIDTYSTNLMGSLHLLEAVRRSESVSAVVMVTSDKCYQNTGQITAFRESDPMGGFDPYSSSKGAMELMVESFRHSYFPRDRHSVHGTAVATARAGNVIGGGDWAADRLLPDAIRAFTAQRKVEIRHPHATRPWQHVLDPLSGYLLLAERLFARGPQYAEGWNFGPNQHDEKSVGWVMDRTASLWGKGAQWHDCGGQHPYEAMQLGLDCSKAREYLGWSPIWGIDQALQKTVEWYQGHLADPTRTLELTQGQISQYEHLRYADC